MTDIAQQIADEFAQDGLWNSCASKIRAELAQLRDRAAKAEDAPILSKYHGKRGFETERFIADYEAWRDGFARDWKGGG